MCNDGARECSLNEICIICANLLCWESFSAEMQGVCACIIEGITQPHGCLVCQLYVPFQRWKHCECIALRLRSSCDAHYVWAMCVHWGVVHVGCISLCALCRTVRTFSLAELYETQFCRLVRTNLYDKAYVQNCMNFAALLNIHMCRTVWTRITYPEM